jgi:hypothetical protein
MHLNKLLARYLMSARRSLMQVDLSSMATKLGFPDVDERERERVLAYAAQVTFSLMFTCAQV